MRTPSTGTLKAFELAARTRSFKAAASTLSITPSAVSHRLKSLEDDLGVQLFHRGTREVTLTDAGAAYLRDIEGLFLRLDFATRQLISRFGRPSLRLRVAPFFASEFLLPRLSRLHAAHPGVDLQVETSGSAAAPLDHADVSIVLGRGPWPDAEVVRLLGQSYVAACAPAVAEQQPIDNVDALNGHAFLVLATRKDAWERWAAAGALEAPVPRKRVLFDTMTELVQATERGLGIGLVPVPLAAARLRANLLTRLFEHELPSAESYYLLCRAGDVGRVEVAEFRTWILEELSAPLAAS